MANDEPKLVPAGTLVTCSGCGAPICATAVDLWPGCSADKGSQFADWRIPVPADLDDCDMPPCPVCGADWHRRDVQAHVLVSRRPRVLLPVYREFVHTAAGWFPPLEG